MSATVLDLFDMQLAAAPHSLAFDGATGPVTYAELDALVRRAGERLTHDGITAGCLVPVHGTAGAARPGPGTVVAMLAAWRCGAVVAWGAGHGAAAVMAVPGAAFVDRTSPGGPVVGHQALLAQARWAVRHWAVTPADRVSCTAATVAELCFEVLLALAAGACVLWPPPSGTGTRTAGPDATIVTVPVGATVAVTEPVRLVLPQVGTQPAAARQVADGISECRTYGLAVAGVVLAVSTADAAHPGDDPIIGRPVDGVRLAVLDEYGEPVPPGVRGALFAGGACVPLGIDADPGTNADRLLPDPFGGPSSRMLRVADAASWRTDGVLQLSDATIGAPRAVAPAQAAPGRRPFTANEMLVADVWLKLLGAAPAGVHDEFTALGGYSLLVPQLAQDLLAASGVEVPVGELFRAPTVAAQAALLDRGAAPRHTPDDPGELAAEAMLDPSIVVGGTGPAPTGAPRHILLTGATGFLGSFLLAELLRAWPDATVVCLARAATGQHAADRLEAAAHRYATWSPAIRQRVVAVPGDLESPLLGLPPDRFDALSGALDLIVHNGAQVHLLDPYQRLRAANVAGTREILRLAAPRAVPVHLVSSIAVLVGPGAAAGALDEHHRLTAAEVGPYGYVRSKWVAEELVWQAAQRGLPVAVYRPSRISGDTVRGVCGHDDAFWTVLRGCVEAAAVPDGPGWRTATANLVPVDHVARAIVHLCGTQTADGRAYHLVNPVPTPLAAVFDRVRAAAFPLRAVPPVEWARRLRAAARSRGPHSAAARAALLVGDEPDLDRILPVRRYDRTGTCQALAGSGISCPPVDAELLDRYLRHLMMSGLRPATAEARP